MGRMTGGWVMVALTAVTINAAGPAEVQAQASRGMLVTAQEMADGLKRPNAVVLHVGLPDSYAAEHVQGARLLNHFDVVAPSSRGRDAKLNTELPTPAELETTLEAAGISDDSEIYVYWSDEWVSPSTRVIYTLDWAGLGDRVHLLNGGLPAWKAAGFATTDAETPVGHGSVTVRPRSELVVDAAWIQAHSNDQGVRIVDARSSSYYEGVQEDRGVAGHIPAAVSAGFPQFLDDDVRFRSVTDIQALLAEAGVKPGDTVVAYCHLGQIATAVVFAARMAGHDVKLYDGSFQDWAARGLPTARDR